MWILIVMTCVELNCDHLEVMSKHETLALCEAAMELQEIKDGQGLVCYKP